MASLGALALSQSSLLVKGGMTFANGFWAGLGGFALIGAAGLIDSRFILPGILGKGPNVSELPKFLTVPQMTVTPGAPRGFSIGRRVRVPCHVMFQSDKIRDASRSSSKGGVPNSVRKLIADVGIALNDRKTKRLVLLTGNGQLIYYRDRNLVSITTEQMVASTASGRLRLTMSSVEDPDFADRFQVDDVVILAGWIPNGGPNINAGYWKVNSVTAHAGVTPSRIDLDIYGGQSLAGLAATAGTVATPASIARVDNAIVDHTATINLIVNNQIFITASASSPEFSKVYQPGDLVQLQGCTPAGINGIQCIVFHANATQLGIRPVNFVGSLPAPPYTMGTSTNAGRVIDWLLNSYPPNLFGADPDLTFHEGNETQIEDPIIAQTETTGEIPGFRGLCYQTIDEFDLVQFGNQLPQLEAILDVDVAMSWGEAITVLCQRSGLLASEVDIGDVNALPFEGYYLRGATTGIMALQPLMVAGQIVAQERADRLAFFNIENADVVQIENGEEFSDLGARVGRDTPLQVDKIRHGQLERADLPTSIGIRHQDPDNVYAEGFQRFGLRQPTAVDHENRQELDLSQLVLTRKQARNLAGTVMRRTWINANTVEFVLPCAYLDVCENDIMTVTDDEGEDITVRVIRRDIGTNYLVVVTAVREHIQLAVSGSPVQGANPTIPPIVNAPILDGRVLDIAPLNAAEMFTPGLYLAACSEPGGHWAGCAVYESTDNGTNWTLVETLETESCLGTTTTTLAATSTIAETLAGGPFWDEVSTVDISVKSLGVLGLSSTGKGEVLAGHNWCQIGDEILGFTSAVVQANGDYRLSQLLRGIRGTYQSCAADKAAGQGFTFLSLFQVAGKFRAVNGITPGSTLQYKFVPSGRSLADVAAQTVVFQGWNARPFPVRFLTKEIGGSPFDARLKCDHWSRSLQAIGYTGPYSLDETYEGYTLRIYDPSGGVVKRTKTKRGNATGSPALRDKWFDYTAVEQQQDGYVPSGSTTFVLELVQLGDYGEGRPNKQTI